MGILKNIINRVFGIIANILVKPDIRIEKLLKFPPQEMYFLLPKSKRSIHKDCNAIFDYGNLAVKSIVKSVKFRNNLEVRKRFATYVCDEISLLASDIELFYGKGPIIAPIPMSKDEKKKRGFNQCEEILSEVKKLNNSFDINLYVLEKTRETARQVNLSREERLKNLHQSIRVPPNKTDLVKNRVVIVFDDVYTTGATFAEARRALGAAGAQQVYGLFLAH